MNSIAFAAIATAKPNFCDHYHKGALIRIPDWADSGKNEELKHADASCVYESKENRQMKPRSYMDWKVNNLLLDRWQYYSFDHCVEWGYVRNLSYFLNQEQDREKDSNGYYKTNDAFKRVYEGLMDECIERCSLISDYQCLYAHGLARMYNNSADRSQMPGELINFASLMDNDGITTNHKQIYFHCSYGRPSRGEGANAINDVNNYGAYLTHDGSTRWCLDGDVYASHTVTYHGFEFNDGHNNTNSQLMIEQGSQEREQFCGQMGEMCIAIHSNGSAIDQSLVTMSSPVSFNIVYDEVGNLLARNSHEGYTKYLASFKEMNEVCLGDSTCIGYNFEALDLSHDYDPQKGKNYKMTVYQYSTADNDAIIQDTINYYRSNIGWHKENAQDPIFEKVNQNNGSSGMVLKLVPCGEYESVGTIEATECYDGSFRVIGSEEDVPPGYRIASTQEAANGIRYLRNMDITPARLADGYVEGDGFELKAYYDEHYCDSYSRDCDHTVLICTHEREQPPEQPKSVPCDRDDCFLLANRDGPFCDECRIATAEEVFQHRWTFIELVQRKDGVDEVGILNGTLNSYGYISLSGMESIEYPEWLAIVKVEPSH